MEYKENIRGDRIRNIHAPINRGKTFPDIKMRDLDDLLRIGVAKIPSGSGETE